MACRPDVTPLADGRMEVAFADGAKRVARVVFGADGLKSKVREAVVGELAAEFTGVTCLMGAAKVPRPVRGICFPSSRTTKNHGCFYPTGPSEQIFQLYFPAKTNTEAWGTLDPEEGARQFHLRVVRTFSSAPGTYRFQEGFLRFQVFSYSV